MAGYYLFKLMVCVSISLCLHPSVHILFPDNSLSKYQWMFTKLGLCIDIMEIWFGLLVVGFYHFLFFFFTYYMSHQVRQCTVDHVCTKKAQLSLHILTVSPVLAMHPWLFTEHPGKTGQTVNEQADLSLCWVHILALQFISFLVLSFTLLTLVLLNPDIPCLCKQCRSRSVGFWRSQLIWICTVCHSVFEFISTTWIKQSDWLKIGNGHGILIYSAGQGLTFQKHIFIAGISLISPWKHTVLT